MISRHKISYPSIPSTIRSTLHCKTLSVSDFNGYAFAESESCKSDQKFEEIVSDSEDSSNAKQTSVSHHSSEEKLNDLTCDWVLSKKVAEMLASRLNGKKKSWNLYKSLISECKSWFLWTVFKRRAICLLPRYPRYSHTVCCCSGYFY